MNKGSVLYGRCSNGNAGAVSIDSEGSSFTLNGGTIEKCGSQGSQAGQAGGVCVNDGALFTMKDSLIDGCYANTGIGGGGGAACAIDESRIVMDGGTIQNCTAEYMGGAIAVTFQYSAGSFEMNGGVIRNRSVTYPAPYSLGGGAIAMQGLKYTEDYSSLVQDGSVTLNGGRIEGNSSAGCGGAISIFGGTLTAKEVTVIQNNNAGDYGGGIVLYCGNVDLSKAVIANNTAGSGACDVFSYGNAYASRYGSSSLSLPDVKNMNQIYLADGNDKYIDGWYWDYLEKEDDVDTGAQHYVPSLTGQTEIITNPLTDQMLLVASYKKREGLETVTTDYEKEYDGELHTIGYSSKVTYKGNDLTKEEKDRDVITYLFSTDGINYSIKSTDKNFKEELKGLLSIKNVSESGADGKRFT